MMKRMKGLNLEEGEREKEKVEERILSMREWKNGRNMMLAG